MRAYDEPIEVRRDRVAGTEAPAQFLWRSRLWVVRDVLTRWRETQSRWEEGPEAPARHGDGRSGHRSDPPAGDPLPAEEEVWRVLAADGCQGRSSLYELVHASSTGQWRLRSVRG